MEYKWFAGWYATRLHAVPTSPEGYPHSLQAECGAWVYPVLPNDWAQRRMDKGLPRCKKCLAIAAKGEE